ncbi:class I SAM-dependent methyltransferase [Pseudomonas brassicacearum]|jgi:Methylase involved in ubiquinone/menaquinone biosynthesis|uniref:Putative SAM-binding motif-containing protein n=1 Tax=Pseudomonas brassicacearum (strain NFM421) TaxID=994484 RepID=F2K976_PSEBN|nr:class I SAM-dependent methyltransferase [Pseudomonas brassicacearum]EIK64312.1 methyltransferase domain protein [Pseudomonas fluorescens Q8r1-96]RDI06173.1 methyltransferase family protein [Pseudomonas fluorescens]AEA67781.1 Putative SAM-binding motif-containing protein [Pseudomonas brassicacearum subsp. brassicacearum NFM421]AOS38714.1 SAM-dependent methyltransferase [Pseudomonas brassicacearum]KAB0523223.1 class I SAM-dependent methyltransferase [Pseudomonas brassicacearum subsp. brassica
MHNKKTELLEEVASYYSQKLALHGETPNGVDWNGEHGQAMRFEQLCKIINAPQAFSINDLGCGYGALVDYLKANNHTFSYLGVDISKEMIQAAKNRYVKDSQARFIESSEPDAVADYSVASGIFNVRLGRSDSEWLAYLENTLNILDRTSRLGFAFNCLTSYSDEDRKREDLYYADPCRLFDLCKRRYSRHVALLHDYGLYEFTLLVRKM